MPGELLREILLDPDLRPDPRGLRLRGALITGELDLSHVTVPCPLSLRYSYLEQPATLQYATVPHLDLRDSHLSGLSLEAVNLEAGAFLDRLTATGEVRAVGAHIGGALHLAGATLTNEGEHALMLDGLHVEGDAFLGELTATGDVRAIGARIAGQLDLTGARLTNEGEAALGLDGARVEGNVFLGGLTANGEVRALGARITGQLDLRGATLTNEGKAALGLDGARIEGGAFLGGLTAIGEVYAVDAHITGQLDLKGAKLTNEGGWALALDRVRVDGNVDFGGLTATGEVRLVGACITGGLNLEGATLANDGGQALAADDLVVGGLFLRKVGRVKGALVLGGARIGNLVVGDDRPAGGLPGPLVASGWHVQNMFGVLRRDRRVAAAWLATQPEFVAQPWHALADVYERNGQPADARILRLRAAHRTTRVAPTWSKPPRWAYGLLVGYGYYPLAAGVWLLIALVIAWQLTSTHKATFAPTDRKAANMAVLQTSTRQPTSAATRPAARAPAGAGMRVSPAVTGATSCGRLSDGYPCLRPFLYSLDVVLPPTVTTGQGTAWRPTTDWIAYVLTGLKTFGWLLTALLLAGVTGLLRKT